MSKIFLNFVLFLKKKFYTDASKCVNQLIYMHILHASKCVNQLIYKAFSKNDFYLFIFFLS